MATISHRTKGEFVRFKNKRLNINIVIKLKYLCAFTGNFQGQLLLNGRPVSEDVMIKLSGFVAQEDVSFDQLTVSEQLKLMVSNR